MGIHVHVRSSAIATVLILLAASACAGSSASPTSPPLSVTPSPVPTASPSPTPSPTATPSPTPSPTASPVPTPPPFNVAQLVADFTSGAVAKNYPAVSAAQVESLYKKLSEQDAALVTAVGVQRGWSYPGGKAIDASNLELCLNRVAGEDNTSDVEFGCELLMTNLISYSNKTGDASVIEFTRSAIGYIVHPQYANLWYADPNWIQALQELQNQG